MRIKIYVFAGPKPPTVHAPCPSCFLQTPQDVIYLFVFSPIFTLIKRRTGFATMRAATPGHIAEAISLVLVHGADPLFIVLAENQ
jgi:hypothetical protein